MCATSKPLELRFHAFLVVLLTTRKCHNLTGEPWTTWISHIFHFHVHKGFLKQLLGARAPLVFSRCSRSNNSFNEATSSRFQQLSIQRAPHDVITPSPPPHPPSVNNNDTCNVTTSSTKQHPQGFNKSQSKAVHMTLLHLPHPPTPHLYTITTFIVHDKIEGSWKLRGTPSLEPIYIYNIYIYIHTVLLSSDILICTQKINQHPHSVFLILLWVGPTLLINMGGHPLWNNTLLENPSFGFKNQLKPNGKPMEQQWIQSISCTKSHESHWKTNGFKAFLILNLMNPIPNLMNPMFCFRCSLFGGENLLMYLDLLGGVLTRTWHCVYTYIYTFVYIYIYYKYVHSTYDI